MSRKEKNYTQGAINEALKEIENGCSISSAAMKYNVPRTTLSAKKRGVLLL